MAERGQPKRGPGTTAEGIARLRLWEIQAVRDLLLISAAVFLIWLGHAMRAVTVPLLVALLLAYLFEPLVARLAKRFRTGRPVVVGALLATVGVVVVALLALLIPVAVGQTAALVEEFRGGGVRQAATDLLRFVPEEARDDLKKFIELLPQGPGAVAAPPGAEPAPDAGDPPGEERIRASVQEERRRAPGATAAERPGWWGVAKGGSRAVANVLGGIVRLGFLAFLIPFYFYFFSVSYPAVARFAGGLVPERNRRVTADLVGKMNRVVAGFVRGRIVISLCMGVLLSIGWWFCGVPYSLPVGMVVGLFCAVPYLGVTGVPLAIALLAFQELRSPEPMAWWGVLLWPTLVFAGVQVVEGYALTPLIAGRATNLDPVTILVAVLAGGSIMGVYGMLLAIPVAACLKIALTDIVLPRVRAWVEGRAEDPLPM